jgi:HlyD family secretion protein
MTRWRVDPPDLPEVDKASRLGRVRVALDGNPPVAIGSFARGVIETGRRKRGDLPLSAITYNRAAPCAVVDGQRSSSR